MYLYFLFKLMLVCFVLKGSDAFRIRKFFRDDYKFIEATQAFYKYHSLTTTWEAAKEICELEGASFFYPKNELEISEVLSLCKQYGTFYCMFVGASELVMPGIFETIDGRLITEMHNVWQSDEPNHLNGTEHCIAIDDKGRINDDSCLKQYNFVCKKSVTTQDWHNNCINLGYTNNRQGKCYKFHKKALSWIDAYRNCRREQSYLAVINSRRERDYLLNLTRVSTDQITEILPKQTFHLGFHNRLDEGWVTVRGTTLNNSGYALWDIDQPNQSLGNNEKCGAMSSSNGQLHDIECDKKSFFICEQDT